METETIANKIDYALLGEQKDTSTMVKEVREDLVKCGFGEEQAMQETAKIKEDVDFYLKN